MNDNLDIIHDANEHGGRYWAKVEGGEAELTYRKRDDGVIVIDRTFTPPEARGGGIARHLTERAVDDARRLGLKIVPQCPYVARLFSERREWADLRV